MQFKKDFLTVSKACKITFCRRFPVLNAGKRVSGMVANSNPKSAGELWQLHTVVELVSKLCISVPSWGCYNLAILMEWLDSVAAESTKQCLTEGSTARNHVVPEYLQAVSSTLWTITAAGKTDLTDIVTPQLLR